MILAKLWNLKGPCVQTYPHIVCSPKLDGVFHLPCRPYLVCHRQSISKKYLCRFYYSISQKVITLSGRRFITVSGVLLHYRAVITLSGVFYYIIGHLLQYRAFITLSVGTTRPANTSWNYIDELPGVALYGQRMLAHHEPISATHDMRCYVRIPPHDNGKIHWMIVQLAMLYEMETVSMASSHGKKLEGTEMKMCR